MPKDKTATHNRIYECMRAEFLEKGFEKASLNHIARQCGITPAAIYRHYSSKEEMFDALVEPVLKRFYEECYGYMDGMRTEVGEGELYGEFSPFNSNWLDTMISFIYEYMDECRLLIMGSKGTKYENCADILIKMEEDSAKEMIFAMQKSGIPCQEVSDEHIHIVATSYVTAFLEIIRHDVPMEKAREQIEFIYKFFGGAWKTLLEIGKTE